MHPYIDKICHAQASANQTVHTCDISLRSQFKFGFIINHKSWPCPISGNAPLGSSDRHCQRIGVSITGSDRNDNSCNPGLAGLTPGLCSMPSSGDRAVGILPLSCSPVHVSSSFVNSPKRPLRHEGESHFEADPLIISSNSVSCGILVTSGTCAPGRQPIPPTHVLTRDASTYKWGVVCGPLMARGVWSSDQSSLRINFLELETVFLDLKRFQRWLCGTHVLVQTDSTTVMHYLNRVGWTRPSVWTGKSERLFIGV